MITMDSKQQQMIFRWFRSYVRRYTSDDTQIQMNLDLKRKHCWRVAGEGKRLSRALQLPPAEQRAVTVMGLLHDVGRFEQYTRFGTFVDQFSVNHAECSADEIATAGILDNLATDSRDILLQAIRWHNRPHLPDDVDGELLFYTRLLRDADKLDIWRVVLNYYENQNGRYNKAISLDLPDTPGCTPRVINSLLKHRYVDYRWCRNANDFKVKQMCWVYDLNVRPSLEQVVRRNIVERFRRQLPAGDLIDRLETELRAYIDTQLQTNSSELKKSIA